MSGYTGYWARDKAPIMLVLTPALVKSATQLAAKITHSQPGY